MNFIGINNYPIYIGSIKQVKNVICDEKVFGGGIGFSRNKVESEVYKETAILIKVAETGGYVDLAYLNTKADLKELKKSLNRDGSYKKGGIIIGNYSTVNVGDLFVDESSLILYTRGKETSNDDIKRTTPIR
jgi:hypothetical protein